MTQHEDFQRLVALQHDGELDPERQALLRQHLASCEICRSELSALQELSLLLAAQPLPASLVAPDLWQSLEPALPPRVGQPPAAVPGSLDWLLPALLLLVQGLLQVVALAVAGVSLLSRLLGVDPSGWLWEGLAWPAQIVGVVQVLESLWARVLPAGLAGTSLGAGSLLEPLVPTVLLVAFSACVAVLYLTWLTAWYQRRLAYLRGRP